MASSIKSVGPYPALLLFLFCLQLFETTNLSVAGAFSQARGIFSGVLAMYWVFCPPREKKKKINIMFTFSLAVNKHIQLPYETAAYAIPLGVISGLLSVP